MRAGQADESRGAKAAHTSKEEETSTPPFLTIPVLAREEMSVPSEGTVCTSLTHTVQSMSVLKSASTKKTETTMPIN